MLTTTITTTSTTTSTTTTSTNGSSKTTSTERTTEKPDDYPYEYIYLIDPANTSTYIHIKDLKPNTPYNFKFEILIFDGKGNASSLNVYYHILYSTKNDNLYAISR